MKIIKFFLLICLFFIMSFNIYAFKKIHAKSYINGKIYELEFKKKKIFKFSIHDLDNTIVYSSDKKDSPDMLFKYASKKRIFESDNECIMYNFKGSENNEIMIWTDIVMVSESNLKSMKINKKPYCIVNFVGSFGIKPYPLNNIKEDSDKWFIHDNEDKYFSFNVEKEIYKAINIFKSKQAKEAMNLYKSIIENNPFDNASEKFLRLYLNYTYLCNEVKNFNESNIYAIKSLEVAEKLKDMPNAIFSINDYFTSLLNTGNSFYYLNQFEKTKIYLNRLIKELPKHKKRYVRSFHFRTANLFMLKSYIQLQEYEKAQDHLKNVIELYKQKKMKKDINDLKKYLDSLEINVKKYFSKLL